MHTPLYAPSDWCAVFHFVAPLIGSHAIYMFLLLAADLRLFSFSWDFDTAFAAAVMALKASCCKEGIPKRFYNDDTTVWIF